MIFIADAVTTVAELQLASNARDVGSKFVPPAVLHLVSMFFKSILGVCWDGLDGPFSVQTYLLSFGEKSYQLSY